MAKTAGYVLPLEAATAEEYTTFAGVPGRFLPGVLLSAHQMGLDEEEIDRLIADGNLPLQKRPMTEADATAEIDRGDNFAPSTEGGVPLPVDPKQLQALSHAELDAAAAQMGVEAAGTKAEKAETLVDAGASIEVIADTGGEV